MVGEKDAIPESILSFSKDVRYLRQCQELLQQLFTATLDQKGSLFALESFDGEWKQESQRIRKQIGWMVSCILYTLGTTITCRTLGMEALGLTFVRDSSVSSKSQSIQMTKTRIRRSLIVVASMLVTATGGFIWRLFLKESPSDLPNDNCLSEGSNQQDYRERSRGRERRLIHERLRREMLERASNANIRRDTPDANVCNQQVQLQTKEISGNELRSRLTSNMSTSARILSRFRQLTKFIFEIYSNIDGPHDIVQSSDSFVDNNSEYRGSTSYSVVLWIVRLHLAHFLLTGKFPSLLHRFLCLEPSHERVGRTNDEGLKSRILDRPTSNRAIAVLIILQASTSLVQTASNWLTKKIANYLEVGPSVFSRRKRKNAEFTEAQVREKLNNFFGNSQSKLQEIEKSNQGFLQPSMGTDIKMNEKKATTLCTICRLERKNPAVPSSCGHVFCWDCLVQWVSRVPECPICRAPCSAKDILPLYNYEPVL